ncbi:Antirestriction protein (ArdA) [Paraburkholderia phenazinium]|uniref:Antirestriction protein (ArdA) n=1 Tax=Paraburkholderia phenazinium TaxID=60549 RepID=A0A1G7YGN9_9BURK|nr:antirestriction protein ArdA [Paraburkholderia phenazinium]SDG95671.1 Antirestriction protein (ArdA) [Paraburkholderia phenazinium]
MTTSNQPNPANLNSNDASVPLALPTAHQTAAYGNRYCAVPYGYSGRSFYFSDMEEYSKGYEAGLPMIEEYSIEFIDGSTGDAQLFNALKIDQSTLERWFDEVEDLNDNEKAALFFLVDNNGMDLDDAMDKRDDVMLREGSELDAGTEIFDEMYMDNMPAGAKSYVDYESFARDLRLNGEIVEFEFDGTTYTCVNASSL